MDSHLPIIMDFPDTERLDLKDMRRGIVEVQLSRLYPMVQQVELVLWDFKNLDFLRHFPNLHVLVAYHGRDADAEALGNILGELTGLQRITLVYVPLKSFPNRICKLPALEILSLQENHLEYVPPEIANLSNLRELRLSFNKLTSLPDEIGSLVSLELLDLHDNQLEFLPDSITQLRYLRQLIVSKNRLRSLPASIGNLRSLIKLHFSENRIEELPPTFTSLQLLKDVSFAKNPLRNLDAVKELLVDIDLMGEDSHDPEVNAYKRKFHEADFKLVHLTPKTLVVRFSIDFAIKEPGLKVPVCAEEHWNEIEKAILRDARIPIPSPPKIGPAQLEVTIRCYDRGTTLTIPQETATFLGTPASFENESQVIALKDSLEKLGRQTFYRDLDELEERAQQYHQQCQLLRAYVTDYLNQAPALAPLSTLTFERRAYPAESEVTPSKCKPTLDLKNQHIILYEKHEFRSHVSTEIRVHESGFIVFFISTYDIHPKAQAYFLSLHDLHFYNRKDSRVQTLGEEDNWTLSYFNDFGRKPPPEPYTRCFICGGRLHYPAQPVKVGDNWIFLLKPCCACYGKIEKNPGLVERGIQRLRKIYGSMLDFGED